MGYLPTIFKVTSLALRQSRDSSSASEITLKDMGKTTITKPQQTWTTCKMFGMYHIYKGHTMRRWQGDNYPSILILHSKKIENTSIDYDTELDMYDW